MTSSNDNKFNQEGDDETVMTALITPGTSSVREFRKTMRSVYPTVAADVGRSLNHPDDIPYLESEVRELEEFLANECRDLSQIKRRHVEAHLQHRKAQLEEARIADGEPTEKILPISRGKPPTPSNPVRRFLKRYIE